LEWLQCAAAKFAVEQYLTMKLKDTDVTAALQISDTVYDLKIRIK
jgi:hypothetical protein